MNRSDKNERISRRKLLASIGAAGVAIASHGLLNGRTTEAAWSDNASVTEAVYGESCPAECTAITTADNLCWNGNMDIWQRGISFTSFPSRKHTADGWSFARTGFAGGVTVSQQTGEFGNNFALRVRRNDGDTSTAQMTLVCNLSASDTRPVIGGKVTASFVIRMGSGFSAPNLTLQLKGSTNVTEQPITAANGFYSSGDSTLAGAVVTASVTRARHELTADVPNTVRQIALRLTYAPTGTAAEDWFEIEQVKIERGSAATPFIPDPISECLRKAQREFTKSYNYDVTVASATSEGALRERARGTEAQGAINLNVRLVVPMRANPTVTVYSPNSGASGKLFDGSGDIGGLVLNINTTGFVITNNAATTNGSLYSSHFTAEAPL